MTKLIIISLMAILTVFATQANAQECMKEAWVKEEADTQGGGYKWIPAKARHLVAQRALLRAQMDALAKFIMKCGNLVPNKLAFNEICVENPSYFGDGAYVAHVRLTYTDAECKLAAEMTKPIYTDKEREKYMGREMTQLVVMAIRSGVIEVPKDPPPPKKSPAQVPAQVEEPEGDE